MRIEACAVSFKDLWGRVEDRAAESLQVCCWVDQLAQAKVTHFYQPLAAVVTRAQQYVLRLGKQTEPYIMHTMPKQNHRIY